MPLLLQNNGGFLVFQFVAHSDSLSYLLTMTSRFLPDLDSLWQYAIIIRTAVARKKINPVVFMSVCFCSLFWFYICRPCTSSPLWHACPRNGNLYRISIWWVFLGWAVKYPHRRRMTGWPSCRHSNSRRPSRQTPCNSNNRVYTWSKRHLSILSAACFGVCPSHSSAFSTSGQWNKSQYLIS